MNILTMIALSVGLLGGWHAHKLYIRRLYKLIHQLRKTVRGK